jgi:hypothetical protein
MKRYVLVLICLILGVALIAHKGMGVCPEDPNDSGECDTLYVEPYPDDIYPSLPEPWLVRFPIFVTNDIPDPSLDSINSIVIPLCYTFTGATYCSLTAYWNNTNLYPFPNLDRSIFRHYIDYQDTVLYNWMMTLSQRMDGSHWDTRILDLDGTSHFWLALFPTGSQDQKYPGGSRILIATMTFRIGIDWGCGELFIDTCAWPPASHLAFSGSDAVTYCPRHFLPKSWWFGIPMGWIECPFPDMRHTNGAFMSEGTFYGCSDPCGYVTQVVVDTYPSPPPEITDIQVVYTTPPGGTCAEGHVSYKVTDHCQGGGGIELLIYNNIVNGPVDYCYFEVFLSNTPPGVDLPETVFAVAGHSLTLNVYGSDPDGDSVEIVDFDTLWYEADPSQPPVSPPSCQPGYPAIFSWSTTESDTGLWICSFLATDACGEIGTDQIVIRVGTAFCGDYNGDGYLNVDDIVFLLGYLFKQGPAPEPLCRGDVNCNGDIEAGDMIYLINYFFRYGPAPCFECCP